MKKLRKRKAISVTSRLERTNIRLAILGVFLFVVIAVYPIVNYTVTNDFISEFQYYTQELSATYLVKGNVACNFGSNYLRSSIVFQDQGDLELYSEIDIYLKVLS